MIKKSKVSNASLVALYLGIQHFSIGQINLADHLNFSGTTSFGYVSESVEGTHDVDDIEFQQIIFQIGLKNGPLSGKLFIDFPNIEANVDAAFVRYELGEITSLTAGKMYSQLLFEEILLVNRATRTHGYGYFSEVIPETSTGIKWLADTEKGWLGVSWLNQIWKHPTRDTNSLGNGSGSVELQLGFRPMEGLEVAIAFGGQDSGNVDPNGQMFDVWISHQGQKHLLALEYTDFENTGVRDLDNDGVYAASEFLSGNAFLMLGSYQISDAYSLALRYSRISPENTNKVDQWTMAPTVDLNDRLSLRGDFSHQTVNIAGSSDQSNESFSIEALFQF